MRFSRFIITVFALFSAASAAEIKLKVVDPQGAAVSGAQVQLFARGSAIPIIVSTTSADGTLSLRTSDVPPYQMKILAPGFAAETLDLSSPAEIMTVTLKLAPAAETVVVTATRNPVPEDASGADTSTLSENQLETMRPIASDDALRYLPGAIIDTAGQRGGLASLFVRGGNSYYNKVIVDGVSITEPGGTFDFGSLPLDQTDRMELVRGTQSTLYGSDAMTSVVQVWTRNGSTPVPELRFGADAGNYTTENGYAALAGAHGRLDYNLFGNQFNSTGSGPNDRYANSLEGANFGVKLNDQTSLRLRARHDNSITGVQGEWAFNGDRLLSPDLDQKARQNNALASAELTVRGPSRWTHRFTGFEFSLKTTNTDFVTDPGRVTPFGEQDFPFAVFLDVNRAGFDYQGDYSERSWAQTTVGYEFEDENGTVNDESPPFPSTLGHGLRRNQAAYVQQALVLGRLTVIAGGRFVHNTTFGNTGVPRVALSLQALRGRHIVSGTRLKFSYATGILEPTFFETFANGPFQIPNPNLKAERNRAFETGFQQNFFDGKLAFDTTYFNNLFHDQINFITIDPNTFLGQYINLQKSFSQGVETEIQAQLSPRLSWNTSYTYTSTEILQAPPGTPFPSAPGDQLLHRPRHSAATLVSYSGRRWSGNLRGSFVGRRPDYDFFGYNIDHAAGYVRVDLGGSFNLSSRVMAYVNIGNVLDRHYNEVVGYPALGANFRAGMRFRIGGD